MDSGTINWTIVSVGIALAGAFITLAAFILTVMRDIRVGIGDIRADMRALSERLGRVEEGQAQLSERLGRVEEGQAQLSERLGRVEEGQGQLSERLGRQEQEQARMNGVLKTIRAGLAYRVERADAGERVAEDAESYEPEG